jgi:hypothetical protein
MGHRFADQSIGGVGCLLVIGGADDTNHPRSQVHATARACHTNARIIPDAGHGPMLEEVWPIVADILAGWLDQRNPKAHRVCGPGRDACSRDAR